MLGNLIENAAKYGGGRVFVTVRTTAECVEIDVEDDGRGIPESMRAEIFDRGVRLDTEKPGTGLGLAIVATWRRFTAARSSSRRARIWAACWRGSSSRYAGPELA
jgi:signal transduction histidine kinase